MNDSSTKEIHFHQDDSSSNVLDCSYVNKCTVKKTMIVKKTHSFTEDRFEHRVKTVRKNNFVPSISKLGEHGTTRLFRPTRVKANLHLLATPFDQDLCVFVLTCNYFKYGQISVQTGAAVISRSHFM